MDLPLLYEISARYAFWNRCAVEQLRTVSSRFVSHFLAQNGEGTARSWKNPMHQTKHDICESRCILEILLSPHIHPPRAARPARFIGLADWMGCWMLLSLYRLQIQVSSVIMNHQNWTGFRKTLSRFHHLPPCLDLSIVEKVWKTQFRFVTNLTLGNAAMVLSQFCILWQN